MMAVYELCTRDKRNEAFVPVIFRFENFSGKIRFHKIPLFQRVLWWARQGLNLRPHPCEGCALPLSYAPARQAGTYGGAAPLEKVAPLDKRVTGWPARSAGGSLIGYGG